MKDRAKIIAAIALLALSVGCVDLFYAKDFTLDEFVQDHVKEPLNSIKE